MIKRMIFMFFLCALILGGAFAYKIYGGMMMMKHMATQTAPTQSVSTIKAEKQEWQNEIKAVGTLVAAKGTDIAPETQGLVESLAFESGQDIEAGAPLLQLRSAEERASLAALESQLKLATLTVERDDKQIKARAISQATYDADKANFDNLQAQVNKQKAVLEKKDIRAPFAGRLGLRHVDIGQYISAGTSVVTLQQLDPLYLDFTLPQQSLTSINLGQKITAHTDAFSDRTFEGVITAIDAKVNETTRNINVRATIPNPEKILLPGLFAGLTLTVGTPAQYLTLPQTAITFNPYGSTVYVVEKDGEKLTAKMAFVKTGLTRGDQVAVLDGIKEGDEIVTAGQVKLRNGSPIAVNNNILPKNNPAPTPQDN